MTVWFCDRCGKQIKRESCGAGKYEITKSCVEHTNDNLLGVPRLYKRGLKFCDECATELEKFLDDEFSGLPSTAAAYLNKDE